MFLVISIIANTAQSFSSAANIISSVPFLLIGISGLARMNFDRTRILAMAPLGAFLLSLIMVGAGSIFYHWSPSTEHLLWDRLPIAICLSAFACAAADIGRARPIGSLLLAPVLTLSVLSVLYWYATWSHGHEDLRAYAVVQLGVVLYALFVAFGRRQQSAGVFYLRLALGVYITGRICEAFQQQIYQKLGVDLGHPLKHLLVALATYLLVRSLESAIPNRLKAPVLQFEAAGQV
jgi:hypothetical protein